MKDRRIPRSILTSLQQFFLWDPQWSYIHAGTSTQTFDQFPEEFVSKSKAKARYDPSGDSNRTFCSILRVFVLLQIKKRSAESLRHSCGLAKIPTHVRQQRLRTSSQNQPSWHISLRVSLSSTTRPIMTATFPPLQVLLMHLLSQGFLLELTLRQASPCLSQEDSHTIDFWKSSLASVPFFAVFFHSVKS